MRTTPGSLVSITLLLYIVVVRVQTDDQDANSHTANIRDQVSKITSSVFVDFIDFLIQQGYISIDGDRGRE